MSADPSPWTPIGDVLAEPERVIGRPAGLGQSGQYGPGARIDLHPRTARGVNVPLTTADLAELRAKLVTNWAGERVWVFPMCLMHGEPVYPRYDLEPGDQRRWAEDALREQYRRYRDEQQRQRGRARTGYEGV